MTVTARTCAGPSVQVFHTTANFGNTTLDPEAIGTSGTIVLTGLPGLSASATSLTFIDWPTEIGIDNLYVTTSCPASIPQYGGTQSSCPRCAFGTGSRALPDSRAFAIAAMR